MTYAEAARALHGMEGRGWKLGLERMERFAREAGLSIGPPRRFFHVAGTNGKGSVTAMLQHALAAAGYRTGAFFSPYVVDLRERIQIGLELISPEEFAAVFEELRPPAQRLEVTEFEMKTAMGFLAWERAECEAVALEVGLGGRLDATNIVLPVATGIVSIGRDHTAILGDTEERIAGEKAGILKPGVPVVIGEMSDEARGAILRVAEARGAPVWQMGREVRFEGECVWTPMGTASGVRPGMIGRWQEHNAALAVGMLHAGGVTDPRIVEGINKARAPGRFEVRRWRGATVVLDGAHNPAAGEALAQTLRERFPGRAWHLVTNGLTGHEAEGFYRSFLPEAVRAWTVPIENARARPPQEAAEGLAEMGIPAEACGSVREALEAARGELVVVTGSNYLVGDALRAGLLTE